MVVVVGGVDDVEKWFNSFKIKNLRVLKRCLKERNFINTIHIRFLKKNLSTEYPLLININNVDNFLKKN